ncbi:MAG: hypothetical protein DMG37_22095 [Acidobacteria bacterium]|nr:MAG: hypothetical protein DMG37_22095 [Acidobacteriota bacterium]
MRQNHSEPEDGSQEDEIQREDGLVRYWMFFNGDQIRLFSALAAAFFGILWCFLYVLGVGRNTTGILLLILALTSFSIWRVFDRQIRQYEESGWISTRRSEIRSRFELPHFFGYLFS